MPRGGRDRPPYIAAESGQRPVNSSRLQRPTAGGGRESVVTGKGLSRCFAGCMVAGRMRRPGKILPRQGAVPLRRLRRHLPLRGRLFGGGAAAQKGSPARGAGCAGRRRLRGALPAGGGNIPQGPAGPCPAFCGRCGGRESIAARKGICRARCGTPPSPAATPPLAGEAFGVCGSPLFPVLRPVCLML